MAEFELDFLLFEAFLCAVCRGTIKRFLIMRMTNTCAGNRVTIFVPLVMEKQLRN